MKTQLLIDHLVVKCTSCFFALVNRDIVEQSHGQLSFLGQSIDLSHNDTLDKEVIAMLPCCKGLIKIKLKGCRSLTDVVVPAIINAFEARMEFCRCFTV